MKIEIEKITAAVQPVVEKLGYELVEVKSSVQYGTDTLTVVIFRKGDMSTDDCEAVHNAVDPIIDALNPSDDKPYNLEVSSMGLDRPLKTDADFTRRSDDELEISLFKKIDGEKKITGFLKSFDSENVTLALTDVKSGKDLGKELVLPRNEIAKAVVAIRFDA